MTQDDRMETITDPAAIRASDEPDERTTPAPVGAAVTLDLDAIEADALAALNPSRCRCTVQSGSVYSSQCPRHDPRDPGYRAPWQMPPATAFALVAEVRRLAALCIPLTDLAQELDMARQNLHHSRAMSSAHFERAERENARAEAAEAEVVTLRARLAALQVAVSHSAESCADGPCEFHETVARAESAEAKVAAVEAVEDSWSRRTLPWPAWPHVHHWLRDLRAALATTGEGQ